MPRGRRSPPAATVVLLVRTVAEAGISSGKSDDHAGSGSAADVAMGEAMVRRFGQSS